MLLQPSYGWLECFLDLGFGVSSQNPQLIGGISAGHGRDAFLTIGPTVGYRTVLGPGNALNDLVTSTYTLNTNKRLQGGWGLVFSFPVFGNH